MNSESRLSRQLIIIIIVVFIVTGVSFGIILPKTLTPIYEKNLFNYLKEPLETMNDFEMKKDITTEIAYIYLINDGALISNNFQNVIQIQFEDLLKNIPGQYGKFNYKLKTYYYYKVEKENLTKIAITNDALVHTNKQAILYNTFPIILNTFLIVALSLIIWSGLIVRRIERLKEKIDNIDNDKFDHSVSKVKYSDEIKVLEETIEDMRLSLKRQESLRNQMYQNISHDFKTPLTVIKSYTEAVVDNVEDPHDALKVIKEQTFKLEDKVHSLLDLNKLDYLIDCENIEIEEVDLDKIINDSLKKFRFLREDVKYNIELDPKVKFYGTYDLWESVIDNIFSNFFRYADKNISITYKRGRLIFYNDGKNIDQDLLDVIFVPYRKGIQGEFGLGMSIIKKTLNIMEYDIRIKNEKKGVSFIITKGIN